jgi:hypothetical protein
VCITSRNCIRVLLFLTNKIIVVTVQVNHVAAAAGHPEPADAYVGPQPAIFVFPARAARRVVEINQRRSLNGIIRRRYGDDKSYATAYT